MTSMWGLAAARRLAYDLASPFSRERRSMLTVCAWCDRFLGPADAEVTHGICAACTSRQHWRDSPVLVVSRDRESIAPVLRELLHGHPEVRVVVDRRQDHRRHAAPAESGVERRSGQDRRRPPDLILN
jgi:hypothetical protein